MFEFNHTRTLGLITITSLFLLVGCDWVKSLFFETQPVSTQVNYAASYSAFGQPSVIPWPNGARLGFGFDSVTGEPKRIQCVIYDGADAEVFPGIGGQNGGMTLEYLNSAEDIFHSLSMSAAASFSYGVYKADVAVSHMQQGKYSRYSEYLLVRNDAENQPVFLRTIRLTAAAQRISSNPVKFYELCGDQFILGQATGGLFRALLQADSSSADEQETTAFNFKGAAGEQKVEGAVNDYFKKLTSNSKLTIDILRGGTQEDFPDLNTDAIIKYARSFGPKVKSQQNAVPVTAYLADFNQFFSTLNYGSQQVSTLTQLANYMRQLYIRRAGLAYIKADKSHEQFPPFDPEKLQGAIAETDGLMQQVRSAADGCATNHMNCKMPQLPNLRDLPDRIRWIGLNPKTPTAPIVSTGPNEHKIVEVRGRWSPVPGPEFAQTLHVPEWYPSTLGTAVVFRDRATGKEVGHYTPDHPLRVPGNSDVIFIFGDSDYSDNRSCTKVLKCDTDDPIRIGVYAPLFE